MQRDSSEILGELTMLHLFILVVVTKTNNYLSFRECIRHKFTGLTQIL